MYLYYIIYTVNLDNVPGTVITPTIQSVITYFCTFFRNNSFLHLAPNQFCKQAEQLLTLKYKINACVYIICFTDADY